MAAIRGSGRRGAGGDVAARRVAARRAARGVRPFPVLRRALPVLRFRGRHARRDPPRRLRRRCRRRDRGPPGLVRRARGRWSRSTSAAARQGCGGADALGAGASPRRGRRSAAPPGAAALEITVEVNPGEIDEAQLGRAARRRASTGCRSACRRSTIGLLRGARPQPRRRGRAGVRARGARGGIRQRVDRSDVRRARAVVRRLAARPSTPRSASARARVGVRADRRARDRVRRAGARRAAGAARRRSGRRDVRARAARRSPPPGSRRTRVSSYARAGSPVAPQPALLGARPLPGRRGVGGVVPAARGRDRLAFLEPARDRRLPARGDASCTSSAGPPPISRTRRSGSGYEPPAVSIAPLIAPVMASIPWSGASSRSSAAPPPVGSSSTKPASA